MSIVAITVGDTTQGRQFAGTAAGLQAAIDSVPADMVGAGNSYEIQIAKDALVNLGNVRIVIAGKTGDAAHTLTLRAMPGHSYREHPNADTNAYAFKAANGAAIQFSDGYYTTAISIQCAYVRLIGLQIRSVGGSDGQTVAAGANSFSGYDGTFIDGCIIEQGGNNFNCNGVIMPKGLIRNTLVVCNAVNSTAINLGAQKVARAENCTVVRPSDYAQAGTAYGADTDGSKVVNCAAFGFNTFYSQSDSHPEDCINNGMSVALVGTGIGNLVYADQFMSTAAATMDFRTKAGSGLINAGQAPASDNNLAAVGSRQQGTSADIGSWEFKEALISPTATVAAISVTGTNVTISGTTTGIPTAGTIELVAASTPFNSALAVAPTSLTFGSGTFTITFVGLKTGAYTPVLKVNNSNYSADGTNPLGDFKIITARAVTLVQDPMDGQVLTVHGTYSGTVTSGFITVPLASANPGAAIEQTMALTLGAGNTFTVSIPLPPGRYDPAAVCLVDAAGTSLPQPGTSAVKVVGIYGSIQADQGTPDTVAPVEGGALTITSVTASGFTLNWQAATDDIGVAHYEYSLDAGSTWLAAGSGTSYAVTGKSAKTHYTALLRAVDFGGNYSGTITASTTTLAVVVPSIRSITLSLVASASLAPLVPAANLSNLRWAWFDQAMPNLFSAPTDHGTVESTDANGVLTIPLPNSALSIGGVGWLIITDSTGNPAQATSAFSGPVAVA